MPKVVVTAQVEDATKWEEGFRTHVELFRSQTIANPIHFATLEGNEVVCCFEPENLETYLEMMDSAATAEAMAFDGVKRETARIIVLDKTLEV